MAQNGGGWSREGGSSLMVLSRLLAMWLPLTLLLGAGVWFLDHRNRVGERTIRQYEGSHIVSLQAELMNNELGCCKSDLLYLSRAASMRRFLAGGDESRREFGHEDGVRPDSLR
jgi:hypothetical protein